MGIAKGNPNQILDASFQRNQPSVRTGIPGRSQDAEGHVYMVWVWTALTWRWRAKERFN
jgi:hypothetical protein